MNNDQPIKRIAIFGSTGSIGTQALEVIAANADKFSAEVLTAHNNDELLVQQALKFHPNVVVIGDEKKYGKIGQDFIEAHHVLPLSLSTEDEVKTKISDLIMVCSNCHKMIHRKRPWLSKKKMKSLIAK